MYEYKGYTYDPEILEDEDTRKYVHNVYLDKYCIGRLTKSHWYMATFEEFKEFVESLIEH
jgi:hypothetical protein